MVETMQTAPRATDRRPRYLFVALIVLLVLRWWLGTLPGYGPDLTAYKQWSLIAGKSE